MNCRITVVVQVHALAVAGVFLTTLIAPPAMAQRSPPAQPVEPRPEQRTPPSQPAPEAIATGVIVVEEPLGLAFTAAGGLLVAAGDEGIIECDPIGLKRVGVVAAGAPERRWTALAVAPDGSIFAVDQRRQCVEHLSAQGASLATFGELRDARGIAVSTDAQRVAVADTGNDRVVIFTIGSGNAPQVIGSRGSANGQFRAPTSIAFDPAGRLFVADSDNHRIQRFGRDGRFEAAFGSRGINPGQFERPMSIIASEQTLLVADHFNHRVQRFDEDGGFLTLWGMHAVVPRQAEGRIHYPVSVAADTARSLFAIAEPFERRVQIFRRSTEGERVPLTPPLPTREGVTSHFGEGVAVDGTLMAVWEPEASAIVVFDLRRERPTHVTTFGTPGRRINEIGRITGIAADEPSERVWLLDRGNDRLVEWTLRRDPLEELNFDPFMGGVTRAIDFDAIARALSSLDGSTAAIDPIAVAHMPGNLLLLDALRARVIRLDDRTLEPVGMLPSADMGFPRHPIAIAVSADGMRLAVLDANDPERLAAIVPLHGNGETRVVPRPPLVQNPKSIAWAGEQTLVVTTGDDRFVLLSVDGRVHAAPELHGVDDGKLWHPRGVAGASDGSFFVVDWGNHRMQRFDHTGSWHSRFGIGKAALRPRLPDAMPAVIRPKRGEQAPVRAAPATERGPFPRASATRDGSVRLTWQPASERGEPLASIPLRDPFYIRVTVAAGNAASRPGIACDAAMPHHGHGMNLAPTTRPIEGSQDQLVGPMLFHMPGAWEIYFDARTDGRLVRLQDDIIMEESE